MLFDHKLVACAMQAQKVTRDNRLGKRFQETYEDLPSNCTTSPTCSQGGLVSQTSIVEITMDPGALNGTSVEIP